MEEHEKWFFSRVKIGKCYENVIKPCQKRETDRVLQETARIYICKGGRKYQAGRRGSEPLHSLHAAYGADEGKALFEKRIPFHEKVVGSEKATSFTRKSWGNGKASPFGRKSWGERLPLEEKLSRSD